MLKNRSNYKKLALIVCCLFLPLQLQAKITNYKIDNYYVKDINSNVYFVIRSFLLNNKSELLAINIKNFNTNILAANLVTIINPTSNQKIDKIFTIDPLKQGNNKNDIYLTVDLCQSLKKGFEENFFKELIIYGKTNKKTINIAISLSRAWAIKHPKEFTMLKEWDINKDLNITWVNHSYSHFYNSKLPNKKNFMLHDINNFIPEVINNEIYMLNNGITPSIFFRFPGLVYNKEILNKLQNLHLIAVDSDAWLAKTKGAFNPSSIILVHGNKNEPLGIKIFLRLLNNSAFKNYEFASINNIIYSYF